MIIECHAAFESFLNLSHVIFEAAQGLQGAVMNDDIVTQQPHIGAAAHQAVGDPATGDLADFADVEYFENLRVAQFAFVQRRLEHAFQHRLGIVDDIVNDGVIADIDAFAPCQIPRLRVGAHVEANDVGVRGGGQNHVRFGDAANAGMENLHRDLVGRQILKRALHRLDGAVDVSFDNHRQPLQPVFAGLREHIVHTDLRGAARGGDLAHAL